MSDSDISHKYIGLQIHPSLSVLWPPILYCLLEDVRCSHIMNPRYIIVIVMLLWVGELPQVQLHFSYETLFTPQYALGPVDIEIKDTKFVETKKPLTIISPLTENFIIKNTGKSVAVVRPSKLTVASVSGGVLGDDIYLGWKIIFYWHDNATNAGKYSYTTIDGKEGTRLEALVLFFNKKYGSFENSLNHRDGLVTISVRVNVVESPPNPLYSPFEYLVKKLKKSGEEVCALSSFTYCWFSIFPLEAHYYAYPGSYNDEETGKTYPATVLVAPLLPFNYVSCKQFEDSFGSLKNCFGKPLINSVQQVSHREIPIFQSKGIRVVRIPG